MIHAYDESYVYSAQKSLARMLDYTVNDLGLELEDVFEWFIGTGIGIRFGRGDSRLIAGMSGVELALYVLEEASVRFEYKEPSFKNSRSREYWTGWVTAYYQWYKNTDFDDIADRIGINSIRKLYNPYHEADITVVIDVLDELSGEESAPSNLSRRRIECGLTQAELAAMSSVPIRTLQQYEQRQKSINKAQAEYVISLAKCLYCKPEELLEYGA